MSLIPKIIHQIWSGKHDTLPSTFEKWSHSWKELHPDYTYTVWNEEDMLDFIDCYYPQYKECYHNLPYNIQRWDVIRYLILYQIGGIYADFDCECLKNTETLFQNKTCCFSMEPDIHAQLFCKEKVFNNAFMASIPSHPFMQQVIKHCFSEKYIYSSQNNKMKDVLQTTGPWMLEMLYNQFSFKDSVTLLPSELVSPLSKMEAAGAIHGYMNSSLAMKLKQAYVVHYFAGTWL
jgi:mannosyltransferase OCH1-like enzyme